MNDLPLTHANVINLLGIASLPLDERQEIVESAIELVETRVMARLAEKLDAESVARATVAIKGEDTDAFLELCAQKGLDIRAMLDEEVERAKQELLEVREEARDET